VHIIQLAFEFQPQLHFLLVVLSVLSVIFLQFLPHLLFVCSLALQLFCILSQRVVCVAEDLLMICLLLEFGLVVTVEFLEL